MGGGGGGGGLPSVYYGNPPGSATLIRSVQNDRLYM